MKKTIYIAGCLAGVFALAACSQEKEALPAAGEEVRLAVSGEATRTVTDFGTGVTRFAEGDAVMVWSEGLAPDMEGVKFTVGADGVLVQNAADKEKYRYCGDEGGSFSACSPDGKAASDGVVEFTVKTDQSSEKGFIASDFMTAEASVSAAQTAPVALRFTHRTALIKVSPEGFYGKYESYMSGVSAAGVYTSLRWNRVENSVSTVTDAEPAPVIFLDAGDVFVAAVPEQEIPSGTKFLTVTTDDGRTFTYTPDKAISLKAGEIFHLKF